MPRRKGGHAEGPHDNEERWLLTYADMITLLMVLFVVMYAISNTDTRKFVQLAQSVSAAFNADVFQGSKSITVETGQQAKVMDANTQTGTDLVQSDMRSIQAQLEDYAIGQGIGGDVSVSLSPEGIVIRLNDALLFASGRAHLDDHALAVIKQVATILKPLPNDVRVEGNTDDQAPDGGPLCRQLGALHGSRPRGAASDGRPGHRSIAPRCPGQRRVQPPGRQHGRCLAGQEPPGRHRGPVPKGERDRQSAPIFKP